MTAVPDLMVTLANGTQVPWSVFRTWSGMKQANNLRPSHMTQHSAEARAKIGASNKGKLLGRTRPLEVCAKIGASNKGKQLGKTRPLEVCAKIGQSLQGKSHGSQAIMTPAGVFPSVRCWARATDYPVGNCYHRLSKLMQWHPDQYYYLPKVTK
jgi:hypothetical protein